MTTWTVACQAALSMEFSRREHWSRWPFLPPGDLLDSGIKPGSPTSQVDSLPSEPLGQPRSVSEWPKHQKATELRGEPRRPTQRPGVFLYLIFIALISFSLCFSIHPSLTLSFFLFFWLFFFKPLSSIVEKLNK